MSSFFRGLSTNQIIIIGLAVSLVSAILVFSGAIGIPEVPQVEASASDNVSGWAYSSNFEWISFNRTDCDANDDGLSDGVPSGCPSAGTSIPNYGVNLDISGTKLMTGYAWSSNIGWIKFGGLGPTFPTDGGTQAVEAQIDTSNNIIGWARACAVFQSGCSGALWSSTELGGWDGWISLSGTNYGVALSGTNFEGYSWDGQNTTITVPPDPSDPTQFDGVGIGWIQWNPPFGGVVVSGSAPPVDLKIDGSDGPISRTVPTSYTLSWTTENSPTSCTASENWSGAKSTSGGSEGPISISSAGTYTYTLTCTNNFGSDSDSVTANVFPQADLTLSADPSEVEEGGATNLTWTSSGVVDGTCNLTSSDPANVTIASPTTGLPANFGSPGKGALGIIQSTIFTITCDTVSGVPITVSDNVTVTVEEEIFHF